ncbi:MAG: hypothetical protein DCC68_25620 [Planctomycetota bacterium]|nr:MAG: hypothetical protein DCC68_25620 [Planctomycetota bacterium]
MENFDELRALARRKRDAARKRVQAEYEITLRQIARLERSLGFDQVPGHRKMRQTIDTVIPVGRDFTADEVHAALETADPKRAWAKGTVDKYLLKLRKNGIIQRVRIGTAGKSAIYRRAEHPTRLPERRTLMQTVDDVLTGPMTLKEIVVAVLAAGFVTIRTPTDLGHQLTYKLRNGPFRFDGDRWEKN